MTQETTGVVDNPALHRYELSADGHTAFSEYQIENNVITFLHTEVPDAFRGKGVGSKLVRGELDAARQRGLKVIGRCEFVAKYIENHPEYHDLLAKK